MGGILIGKFSHATENKVPTFLLRSSDRKFYYANAKWGAYKYKTSERSDAGTGMFLSAPELLAFWSEEE